MILIKILSKVFQNILSCNEKTATSIKKVVSGFIKYMSGKRLSILPPPSCESYSALAPCEITTGYTFGACPYLAVNASTARAINPS